MWDISLPSKGFISLILHSYFIIQHFILHLSWFIYFVVRFFFFLLLQYTVMYVTSCNDAKKKKICNLISYFERCIAYSCYRWHCVLDWWLPLRWSTKLSLRKGIHQINCSSFHNQPTSVTHWSRNLWQQATSWHEI